MRRSFAPSIVKKRLSCGESMEASCSKASDNANNNNSGVDENGDITISRLPLFGFLEIPEALNRKFKVPAGCVLTEQSIALRKVKTLGPSKNINIIRPGHYMPPLPKSQMLEGMEGEQEDLEAEELPTAVSASLPPFEPLVLWRDSNSDHKVEVIPEMCCKLRPHQREGVSFLFECTMGLRGFEGEGCILADDMGLGKTFMSITLIWTLMNQGFQKKESAVRKVIVACPTSLVGNWDKEIKRWVGERCETFPVKSEPKRIIKNFLQHRGKGVLIVSYETQRRYSKMFESAAKSYQTLHRPKPVENGDNDTPAHAYNGVCELLICDEAHKLKNSTCEMTKSLFALPAKKRVLLSGTPMQNELTEFYNMVNFCNPMILGSLSEFRKRYERPILRAREPDSSDSEQQIAKTLQRELSTIVNEFILKRGNILNAKHLPPKLVQYLVVKLTPLQEKMYESVLSSKEVRHIRDGKQSNTLNCIRQLINICSHPQLIMETYKEKLQNREKIDDDLMNLVKIWEKEGGGSSTSSSTTTSTSMVAMRGNNKPNQNMSSSRLNPELSGKLRVLYRMMQTMKAMKNDERIVIVSNYTQTLDMIEQMCRENQWEVSRLDGSTGGAKRHKLVETFNDRSHGQKGFAFLLSSKAGGCGINLIGANRLVLFDPDWNPASDKQAAGRVWREGQQKRCYIYRFMSCGSIEEKIIQRQLSKEGLQNIVDNTDQVNLISTEELRRLFTYRSDTRSDTHDTLRCKRCSSVTVLSNNQSSDKLPLSPNQCLLINQFLTEYMTSLSIESPPLAQVMDDMKQGSFSCLPELSRKLRDVIGQMERDQDSASMPTTIEDNTTTVTVTTTVTTPKKPILDTFVSKWCQFVPVISQLRRQEIKEMQAALRRTSTTAKKNRKEGPDEDNNNGDDDGDDELDEEEFVEQEGCPDETDFNRWSHHCSVNTCDDDILQQSMSDDNAVSFVFGLEINFEMLTLSEESKREEVEERKRQLAQDIQELNERRKRDKQKKEKKNEKEKLGSDDEGDDDEGDDEVEGIPDNSNGNNSSNNSKSNDKKQTKATSKANIKSKEVSEDASDNHGSSKTKKRASSSEPSAPKSSKKVKSPEATNKKQTIPIPSSASTMTSSRSRLKSAFDSEDDLDFDDSDDNNHVTKNNSNNSNESKKRPEPVVASSIVTTSSSKHSESTTKTQVLCNASDNMDIVDSDSDEELLKTLNTGNNKNSNSNNNSNSNSNVSKIQHAADLGNVAAITSTASVLDSPMVAPKAPKITKVNSNNDKSNRRRLIDSDEDSDNDNGNVGIVGAKRSSDAVSLPKGQQSTASNHDIPNREAKRPLSVQTTSSSVSSASMALANANSDGNVDVGASPEKKLRTNQISMEKENSNNRGSLKVLHDGVSTTPIASVSTVSHSQSSDSSNSIAANRINRFEWHCNRCTFVNKSKDAICCEMCGEPKVIQKGNTRFPLRTPRDSLSTIFK